MELFYKGNFGQRPHTAVLANAVADISHEARGPFAEKLRKFNETFASVQVITFPSYNEPHNTIAPRPQTSALLCYALLSLYRDNVVLWCGMVIR